MKISREKVNHISSLVVKDLAKREEFDHKCQLNEVRLEVAKVMLDELKKDELCDQEARKTVASYANSPREGSPEWDVLYHKHYEEQLTKHGM